MARWIVLVSPVDGVPAEARNTDVLRELSGTEEEAMNMLLDEVNTYTGSFGRVRRRQVFRCSERSYFVRLQGRMFTYGYSVQLAELVADSQDPGLPDAVASDRDLARE